MLFRIGEVARRVGLHPRTIRFYEARGLLPPPRRAHTGWSSAGYRLYGEQEIRRLEILRQARSYGLTLAEMKTLLQVAEEGCCGIHHPHYQAFAESKVKELDRKITELQALRDGLKVALARQDCACRSESDLCGCVIGGLNTPDRLDSRPGGKGRNESESKRRKEVPKHDQRASSHQ